MKTRILSLLAICVLSAPLAVAHPQNTTKPAPPANGKPVNAGFRAEFFANLDEVQGKIMDLATATPAEKFAWSPSGDVRTISGVYMHVAGGNYFLATFLGAQPPKPSRDLEKTVTSKAAVLDELKRSFDHLRKAANNVADLEKPVKLFGNSTTQRGVLVTMLSHLHEHLGQSIAYARMNGIVPPWSR